MATRARHIQHARPQNSAHSGAIELSYFNLFWIFIITGTVGLLVETVVSFMLDGHWESRAGLVFGPFSPIYGVGALLITIALNRLSNRNPLLQFAVAGFVGAGFEYLAGWLLESCFGIVAWSYEGQLLSIHGHTSLFMACIWGLCGLLWIRAFLPAIMKLIERIPQSTRRPLTIALSIVLFADVILTIGALDCWYLRTLGMPIETPQQAFFAQFFGDQFMQSRFETMSMWTTLALR